MTKKRVLPGILVLVLGIMAVGCSKTDPVLNGTWAGTFEGIEQFEFVYTFRNGKFENSAAGLKQKGTFTTENGEIAFTSTHVNGDGWDEYMQNVIGLDLDWAVESKWYTVEEFILAVKPNFLELGVSEEDLEEIFGELISSSLSIGYSVEDKSLLLTMGGETLTLQKK